MSLKDTINYFCTDVDVDENGCWRNRKYKNYSKGYFSIRYLNKIEILPRLILIDRHGRSFMKNYVTRHLCHNNGCINPWHIVYGTQQDNVDDCIRANRRRQQRGSKNVMSKLIEKQVREIKIILKYNKSIKHHDIGNFFGVSRGTISNINNGRIWKHVTID